LPARANPIVAPTHKLKKAKNRLRLAVPLK
jgi:hypothetical protein